MVHGELGWPWLEVVSTAGICLSGVAALKYGWMSVRAGETTQAVTVASELVSSHLRAPLFEPELDERVRQLEARPEIAFEKDFLRLMLSDGAGAVLLSSEPGRGLSLRLDWITMSSAAQELPACMYGGAHRRDDGSLVPWHFLPPSRWLAESTFTVRQDVRLLDEHVVRATLVEPLQRLRARRPVQVEAIDWFLPHISSMYFAERVVRGLEEAGLPIPRERWFSNLVSRGNTGSASPFIMLDELLRSGRVEPGQRLLMFVPESGRFSSGFVHLTAVQGRGDAL
jgi:3-oxoacyl-[acyl-carrier-protein] synthase-3